MGRSWSALAVKDGPPREPGGKTRIHQTARRHGIESHGGSVGVRHEISVDVQHQVRVIGSKETCGPVGARGQNAGYRFGPAINGVEVRCQRLRLPAREGRKKSERAVRNNRHIQRIRLRGIRYSAGAAGNGKCSGRCMALKKRPAKWSGRVARIGDAAGCHRHKA